MKELNDDEVATFAAATGVVALDFFAPWCRPCTMLAPLFAKWEKTYTAFNISHLPTIIILKNGVEVKRFVGMVSENDFKDAI